MFTTEEVADTPEAVATAVRAYAPGLGRLPVTLKGERVACPSELAPAKYSTLVTVSPVTLALAVKPMLAGAAYTAPSAGLVMVTEGGAAAAGVERVYANLPPEPPQK